MRVLGIETTCDETAASVVNLSGRGVGEILSNEIMSQMVAVISPRFLRLTAEFYVRGGIYTTVVAQHQAASWTPPAQVILP